jgi:hypothetical protein
MKLRWSSSSCRTPITLRSVNRHSQTYRQEPQASIQYPRTSALRQRRSIIFLFWQHPSGTLTWLTAKVEMRRWDSPSGLVDDSTN